MYKTLQGGKPTMLEYINLIKIEGFTVPEEITKLFGDFVGLFSTALVMFAFAFFGYRIFKAFLPVIAAASLGGFAYGLSGTLITGEIIAGIDLPGCIALATAILALVFCRFTYRFGLFLFNLYAGYTIGLTVLQVLKENLPDVSFFGTVAGELVISIACAVVYALLMIFLFKPLYIIISSIGGMTICAGALVDAVLTGSMPAWYFVLPVGAVIGIFAMIKQFRDSSPYRAYRR